MPKVGSFCEHDYSYRHRAYVVDSISEMVRKEGHILYEFLTILAVIVKYFLIVYAFIIAAAVITKFVLWKRERDRMKQKAQEPIRYIYTKEGKIVNLSRQQKS